MPCAPTDTTTTWLKRWALRAAFYRLLNAFEGFEVPPDGGDFRLMDRAVVDALLSLPERQRFMKGMPGSDSRLSPCPICPQRAHGRSHFNLRRLLSLSLVGLTAFTTWPLRLATIVGMADRDRVARLWRLPDRELPAVGPPGLRLDHRRRRGVAMLGIQMVLLGIVGEYIGRIFEEVKSRPLSGPGCEGTGPEGLGPMTLSARHGGSAGAGPRLARRHRWSVRWRCRTKAAMSAWPGRWCAPATGSRRPSTACRTSTSRRCSTG